MAKTITPFSFYDIQTDSSIFICPPGKIAKVLFTMVSLPYEFNSSTNNTTGYVNINKKYLTLNQTIISSYWEDAFGSNSQGTFDGLPSTFPTHFAKSENNDYVFLIDTEEIFCNLIVGYYGLPGIVAVGGYAITEDIGIQ